MIQYSDFFRKVDFSTDFRVAASFGICCAGVLLLTPFVINNFIRNRLVHGGNGNRTA